MNLTFFEIALIILYFGGMLGIGIWHRRASAKNLDSYFLGGRKTPWWMLGFSGSVSNFDIAGTTWIVGMFFFLGFKAFNMFWAFAFLIAAFLMSYLAGWIRRTKVMTAAELIKIRFGDDTGGRVARSAAAVATVVFFLFALGYSFVGVSKFLAAFLDYDERLCATVLMLVTGIYVLLGGFKGVILSDVIQAFILNACGVAVAVIAFMHLDIPLLHSQVDPSPWPTWSAPELAAAKIPEGYQKYALFGPLFLLFLCKGILGGMASPGGCYEEQRFLAAASPKDAAKTGAAWGGFLVFRWMLAGSIAFLGLTQLQGVTDPEQVLSAAVFELMPGWLRGFLITGLLAAFMSTFSSTLNGVSSIIVRDLFQAHRPSLTSASLVKLSYLVTGICIVVGIWIGWNADSIQKIFLWMQLALMPSLLFPNLLRWYWWRMNGWGYAAGVITGLLLATLDYFKESLFGMIGQAELYAQWSADQTFTLYTFPLFGVLILIACVLGSLQTKATSAASLQEFFKAVRPKGRWGPVREQSALSEEAYYGPKNLERPSRIIFNILMGKVTLMALFVGPLYLVGHWFTYAAISGVVFVVGSTILYYSWYRRLEE